MVEYTGLLRKRRNRIPNRSANNSVNWIKSEPNSQSKIISVPELDFYRHHWKMQCTTKLPNSRIRKHELIETPIIRNKHIEISN